jgi:hypothetical protein
MQKIETVAQMAATLYAAGSFRQPTFNPGEIYERIATQAWALYEAVEKVAAEQHSSGDL